MDFPYATYLLLEPWPRGAKVKRQNTDLWMPRARGAQQCKEPQIPESQPSGWSVEEQGHENGG